MADFGWSYPPGCSGTPFDGDFPCEICGGWPDKDCICPECPECGAIGDPYCYQEHGLLRSEEQKTQLCKKEKEWDDQARAQAEYENHQNLLDEDLDG